MMHASDTARRSARRKPDLNINTTPPLAKSSSSTRDGVTQVPPIPKTPPARLPPTSSKGKRALRAPSARDTADIETFLDSLTPIDMSNKENDRPDQHHSSPPHPRDSHDLSLPARQVTRDSLVANMLLSLDQLSMGQINGPFGGGGGGVGGARPGYDDPAIFGNDERNLTFTSRSGRGHGHGHGYSYSSDLDGADDASRISSRGRRSNSSSGFQSSLGRINSMRETSHHRSIPGTPKPMHSRGGRGSKSSSTNSIDAGYAQVLSSQRWARGFGGRSSSFDGGEPPRAQPATAPPTASPWHIEFSNSFFNDGYDAAPTPTVPAGPRRLATVPSLPVMPPPEPKMEPKSPGKGTVLERRRSTRSSRSATVGRKDAKFAGGRDVPPVPALDLESAPAPHVGYEKSKEAMLGGTIGTPQTKDKPGFFRRMFGSSKVNLSATASSSTVETPASKSHLTTPTKSPSAPPSRESHHSTTHTLQKKTSAFFRRRKPSITDPGPPPVPNLPSAPTRPPIDRVEALSAKPEPSPVTSLRRAMDPFLHTGPTVASPLSQTNDPIPPAETRFSSTPTSPATKIPRTLSPEPIEDAQRRNTRGFSPDYDPSPRAVIRAVDPESGEDDPSQRRFNTPSRQPPEPPRSGPAGSFLQDDSDEEESPRRLREPPAPIEKSERNLKPMPDVERRRSPSPTVSKSKSVPNLARSRESARISSHHDLKHMPSLNRGEMRDSRSLGLPIEGVSTDGTQGYKPVASLPSLRVESAEPSPKGDSINQSSKSIDEPEFVVGDPTEDDRQKAQKIYDGNEDFIQKDRAAAWMGEEGTVRQRTLRAYMDLYDFENISIVSSLRLVCQRLLLRAETQQVDRILVAFAKRWCDCNSNHGFKAAGMFSCACLVGNPY